jgi:cellulose synthase/poly-beta-1,6-N-acetylglucosamine synthase-like glycosyltransferase
VVIAARNEEKNIPHLLSCIAEQQYPRNFFEVIIIDDHSTDNTWQELSSYTADFSLKLYQLPEELHGKKSAIDLAVKNASGELIVQTDADCSAGPGWLASIAGFYKQTGAKFIAAPVTLRNDRSLLGIFQSLDFLTMQTITGASVFKRFHTMCNGANLAFVRSAFVEVNGFEGIDNIPSGDDMLLMHKIYSAYPDKVAYLKSSAAIVQTAAPPTWKDFFNQRIRWSSKAVHYKDKRIFNVLLLTYTLNVCFLGLGIAAVVSSYWLSLFLLFLLAKVLIEFPFVNAGAIFFGQQRLMKWFPFLQPLHILYVIIAGWLGRFGSYQWKDRLIKNNPPGNLAKQ